MSGDDGEDYSDDEDDGDEFTDDETDGGGME